MQTMLAVIGAIGDRPVPCMSCVHELGRKVDSWSLEKEHGEETKTCPAAVGQLAETALHAMPP